MKASAVLSALLIACTRQPALQIDTARASADMLQLRTDAAGSTLVEGLGFAMRVPIGTTLRLRGLPGEPPSFAIVGPHRPTPNRKPQQGSSAPEPSFAIDVTVAARTLAGSLDQWVDSVAKSASDNKDPNVGQIGPAQVDSVGHQRALTLMLPGGDTAPTALFVASGTRVIEFVYALGYDKSGSLGDQERLTRQLLDSITWVTRR